MHVSGTTVICKPRCRRMAQIQFLSSGKPMVSSWKVSNCLFGYLAQISYHRFILLGIYFCVVECKLCCVFLYIMHIHRTAGGRHEGTGVNNGQEGCCIVCTLATCVCSQEMQNCW